MADERRRRFSTEFALIEALAELRGAVDFGPDPGDGLVEGVADAIGRLRGAPSPQRARRPSGIMPRHPLGWRRPVRRGVVVAVALIAALALAAAAATFGVRGIRLIFGPPPVTTIGPSGSGGTHGPPATGSPGGAMPSTPPSLGRLLNLGVPVSLGRLGTSVPFAVRIPSFPGLGAPSAFVSDAIPGGVVNLVYPPGPGVPREGQTEVGILITEFVGRVYRPFLTKYIQAGTTVRQVDVGGAPGLWISGAPHQIAYIAADGAYVQDSFRFSGPVLVWRWGEATFRIESALPERRAVAIAVSMR